MHFETFAQRFVRSYWETVKSGAFPMPPNEPIDETVEELLSAVSHRTELDESRDCPILHVQMTGAFGDWWRFSFREAAGTWMIIGGLTNSNDKQNPHDLLGSIYEPYFGSFLRHVTSIANEES
jgi:hypothetical protein